MEVDAEIQPISHAKSQVQNTSTNTDDPQPTAPGKKGPPTSRGPEREGQPNPERAHKTSTRTDERRASETVLPTSSQRTQNSCAYTEGPASQERTREFFTCTGPETEVRSTSLERTKDSSSCTGPKPESLSTNPERTQDSSTYTGPETEGLSTSPERTQDSSTCTGPKPEGLSTNPDRTQDSSTCTGPKPDGLSTSPERAQDSSTCTGPETEGLSTNPERTQDSSTCTGPKPDGLSTSPERTQDSFTCTGPETEGLSTSPERTQGSPTCTGIETEGLPRNDITGGTTKDGILRMRKYQLELTEAALQGTNCIICAPRGCGKTVMAGHVIQQLFLQKKKPGRPFRALFLINRRRLVEQKLAILCAVLNRVGLKVGMIDEGRGFKRILESVTVVVLTAMAVINAIKNGCFKLTDVDLLVFDECHHSYGGHPYNELMRTYMESKLDDHSPELPQILGLTAASRTVKFKTALDLFLTLCGNLDCYQISQVRENLKELEIFHPKPSKVRIIAVPRRAENDPFRVQLLDFMREIQKNIKEKCEISPGTHEYETWAFSRKKTAEKKRQLDTMMTFNALLTLNSALIVHEELRGIDSLKILQDFFLIPPPSFRYWGHYEWSDKKIEIQFHYLDIDLSYSETEEKWYKQITTLEPELKLLVDGADDSTLITSLRTLLQKQHHERKDCQGLLLTRTRFLTEKLVQYIKDCTELTGTVRPARLTGQEGDQYSMMEEEQMGVLQQFNNGTINLLVATDMAEGVDLPQCDYIICYNVTTNKIGALQSRGKARHCYLIVQEGSDVERKELENRKRMRQIEEILDKFKNEDPNELSALIGKKQREDWESYKSMKKLQGTSGKLTKPVDPSRVLILCIRCNKFLTSGEHIIKKGTFYICVDKDLPDQVIENRWDEADPRWKVLSTAYHAGEILCGNNTCSGKLGQIVHFRQGTRQEGYMLGRQHIMFDRGGKLIKECGGWSKVTFNVEEEAIDE